jgi:hypothetical protein
MSASPSMSGSESPSTSAPGQAVRRPSKSKALECRCQKIHDWYSPPNEAARIEVPKRLKGIGAYGECTRSTMIFSRSHLDLTQH